jgi:heat shock protein HslJ
MSSIQQEMKMKRISSILSALLVIAGYLLAACSSNLPASLTGTWRLASYGSPSSQTPTAPNVDTSIEFGSEGEFSGNVGCNGFGGKYAVGNKTITFSEVMSTLMFCEGQVGDQEKATLSVLQGSTKFVLDSNTLTITSADGSSAIVLERK